MKKSQNITKRQHFIPQVYMRGFSPEYLQKDVREIPYSRYTIYCHDLNKEEQLYKAVPIKSVCYKNYLYEVTGHDGEIVLANYLEKFFSVIEKMFGEYRYKLEKKAFITDNCKTNCFLKQEEKIFWVTYILIQILRMPQILELAEKVSLRTWENELNNKQAKNVARRFCLPFFEDIEMGSKEMILLNSLFEPMKDMFFGIGVDLQGRVITSDKPVRIFLKQFPCKEYEKIIFPISSQLCLFMFSKEYEGIERKNFLFIIDEYCREQIIKSISLTAFSKVYSNHAFNAKERKCIRDIMKVRECGK